MRKPATPWWQGTAILAIVMIAAGCSSGNSPANRQFDPGVRAAAMITGLERTDQQVTKEQAGKLLPLFRALRGTAAEDRPAIDALVRQIDGILTNSQRDALRRLREQRRPGPPGSPPGGPPGSPGFGQGGPGSPGGAPPGFDPVGPGQSGGSQPSAERLAAFRGQILDRAIGLLETRVQ